MAEPNRGVRVALSACIAFHLVALAWWNLGVANDRAAGVRPPGGDVWSGLRSTADLADPSETVRGVLTGYIRVSGLWQRWESFVPEGVDETGRLRVRGVTGFDDQGRPTFDPVPVHDSEDPDVTDVTQMIGNPPCGWSRGPDPRITFLRGAYARFHAARAERERSRRYVGVQFSCERRRIHEPGEDPTALRWTTDVLWAGPIREQR